jgi:phosphoglycolate phosphatase-like HAD superfamily hydrolase
MAELGPVIWDVDGTLAATTELGFSATNATLQDAGLRRISREEYEVGTRLTHAGSLQLAHHRRCRVRTAA